MRQHVLEIAILVIGFVVAVAGLMQVFQEEALAVAVCDNPGTCVCGELGNPNTICLCEAYSSSNITCGQWCSAGRPRCEIPDP